MLHIGLNYMYILCRILTGYCKNQSIQISIWSALFFSAIPCVAVVSDCQKECSDENHSAFWQLEINHLPTNDGAFVLHLWWNTPSSENDLDILNL